jgi:subtilisin-like proprotein convertase family protein
MKKKYKSSLSILFFVCFFASLSYSQNKKAIWNKVSEKELNRESLMSKSVSKKAKYYSLDINELKTKLKTAPKRSANNQVSQLVVDFPDENGKMNQYRIKEASIMAPELQSKYPELQSFVGQNINKPESTIRFSITPRGLNAMIFSSTNGTQYIDPSVKDRNIHTFYSKRDLSSPLEKFECGFEQENSITNKTNTQKRVINANDGKMRTFRLALATTIEYSAFHIAAAEAACGCTLTTVAEKKAAVMAELVVAMTRVNFIYERDLSLTMELVGNNDDVIFVDGGPDEFFSNESPNDMLNQNQNAMNFIIGNENFDIGHVFSTGAGGVAILNSACDGGNKAKGVTGLGSPVGDPFYVDYVSHEMGHQFGAPHTFNSESQGCGPDRSSANAYEPGSGSTIMAYAGLCAPDNIQTTSDAYFHQNSLELMWNNIETITTSSFCASESDTGNSAPTAEAGDAFTIPGLTPYKLTGSSTDADGTSAHTFTWEQYDLGSAGLPMETNVTGPLVRSYEGTNDPSRTIPNLIDVLSNGGVSTTWEKLASVDRAINYQLIVRDNDINGGQTATDNVTITVDGNSGPLKVSSQDTAGIVWNNGNTEVITWDVAGTDQAPVSTSLVNILLSLDGGLTYTETLAENTPNDGSESITVPVTPAAYCRIMIQPVDNIYFAINSEDFAIDYNVSTTCVTYTSSSNLNLAIPDNNPGNPLVNSLNFPDSNTIDYISVSVGVDHTWVSDLKIQIQDPNGNTLAKLWDMDCNDQKDLDITFKDGNPSVVCAEPAELITGNYSPASPLSVFSGLNSSGNWNISISDNGIGDTGTLNYWSIEVCSTVVTNVLNVEEEVFEGFKIFPNPSNGAVNVSLLTDQQDEVNIGLYDVTGRLIRSQKFASINQNFNEQFSYGIISEGVYILRVSQGNKIISKIIAVN